MEHNWPGNVRELKNIIERLMIMTLGKVITAEDIPLLVKEGSLDVNMKRISANSLDYVSGGQGGFRETVYR